MVLHKSAIPIHSSGVRGSRKCKVYSKSQRKKALCDQFLTEGISTGTGVVCGTLFISVYPLGDGALVKVRDCEGRSATKYVAWPGLRTPEEIRKA
jgi:hypothetical protein